SVTVPQLEQHFSVSRQRVLMVRIERQSGLKNAPRPRDLFTGEKRVRHPDVEFHGVGIKSGAFSEKLDGVVVVAVVVQLVGVFVVVVGAEKPIVHRGVPPVTNDVKVGKSSSGNKGGVVPKSFPIDNLRVANMLLTGQLFRRQATCRAQLLKIACPVGSADPSRAPRKSSRPRCTCSESRDSPALAWKRSRSGR